MTKPRAAEYPQTKINDKIIVALDVATADQARAIVAELRDEVGAFKIGLQLFTSTGPELVREFTSSGIKIFLDLKFHDIPNTVANAAVEAARLGVWMFNVHTLGGGEMMRRTVEVVDAACEREHLTRPRIIGVTILTSSDRETLHQVGIDRDTETEVIELARLAAACGLDGVVASPLEAEKIRRLIPKKDFLIVTPGIRADFATGDDQKRVTTLGLALAHGAGFAVIGRPIIEAEDHLTAVRKIVDTAGIGN